MGRFQQKLITARSDLGHHVDHKSLWLDNEFIYSLDARISYYPCSSKGIFSGCMYVKGLIDLIYQKRV